MTLMMVRHSSNPKCRDAIGTAGIRPGSPSDANGHYRWLTDQPRGVYGVPVFNPYTKTSVYEAWHASTYDDVWVTFWCGEMINDPLVEGAIVIQTNKNVPALLVQASSDQPCLTVDLGISIAGV